MRRSIRCYLRSLSRVYEWDIVRQLIESNPTTEVMEPQSSLISGFTLTPPSGWHIIGVDEVAVSALAGPLVACAVSVPIHIEGLPSAVQKIKVPKKAKKQTATDATADAAAPQIRMAPVRDSKRLSARQILEVAEAAKVAEEADSLHQSTCTVPAEVLSANEESRRKSMNDHLADCQCLAALSVRDQLLPTLALGSDLITTAASDALHRQLVVLLDGGTLPHLLQRRFCADERVRRLDASWRGPLPQGSSRVYAIPQGDDMSFSIALASVLAKQYHDKVMTKMHEEYPQYGFASHHGYGTPVHLAALEAHGPCPHHRMNFAPVAAAYQSFRERKSGWTGAG